MEAILSAPQLFSARNSFPLAMATEQAPVTVCHIKGKDDTRKFLAELGFVEGSHISVVSQQNGNLIADVKGSRIALSRQMACRILVCE